MSSDRRGPGVCAGCDIAVQRGYLYTQDGKLVVCKQCYDRLNCEANESIHRLLHGAPPFMEAFVITPMETSDGE